MKEFRMPSLGADMDAGTLVEWLKSPGDVVKRGDIIAVVETQKGAIEIEVFDDGVLSEVRAQPGDEVPVGHVLALIDGASSTIEPAPADSAKFPAYPSSHAEMQIAQQAIPEPSPAGLKISPAARRLAQSYGLDPGAILPGKDDIVGLREVEAAARRTQTKRPAVIDQTAMRKAIAAAMARSNQDIPHYYVTSTIDVTPMMEWLAAYNARQPIERRLLYAVPLLRAAALSLRKFDDLNGAFVDGRYQRAFNVNIGVAIAMRQGGLIAPAILDTDSHDLTTLMSKLNDLVRRARKGGLRSSELSMATATLTNLGERTADTIMPIIYPPQVFIIGCGHVRRRPWIVNDAIVPRQLMDVTVAGDHRVSDGRRGAQYLRNLDDLLARPEAL
jgi:pyruvate dehydrogenase E2 component (dihydrolipoyllysine-residue acetyltransferase)